MARSLELPAGEGRRARIVVSERADGDLARGAPGVAERRAALLSGSWTVLEQVHGARAVVVDSPGGRCDEPADAAVSDVPGAVLSVQTADCAPVVLVADGAVGIAHAGWRGLAAGVLDATVEAVRARTSEPVRAWLGPCIGVECYEFGEADLRSVVDALGAAEVAGRTASGAPALDLAAGVRAALSRLEVELVGADGRCTSCDAGACWSHRARGDAGRHATAVRLEVVT